MLNQTKRCVETQTGDTEDDDDDTIPVGDHQRYDSGDVIFDPDDFDEGVDTADGDNNNNDDDDDNHNSRERILASAMESVVSRGKVGLVKRRATGKILADSIVGWQWER